MKQIIQKINNHISNFESEVEIVRFGYELEKEINNIMTKRLIKIQSDICYEDQVSEYHLDDCNNIFL